ncbi:MAG: MBL fold metallo-hydrolase, partial [Clostridia bacterium]|nr:MBL fold metallo-hydrolase [Clostridia bacterium]
KGLLGDDQTPNGDGSNTSVGKPQATATLEMRVLDVGQGDCILLLFPDGQTMVMDIGNTQTESSRWSVINGALTDLEITTIDYLFLTHTDYDHIREAEKLINNYEIKTFYYPKEVTGNTATWTKAVTAAKAETYVDEDGNTQQSVYNENVGYFEIVGATWIMKCYTYDEEDYPSGSSAATDATLKNAVSPICLLEFADRTIVLTGDSNYTNEDYLLNKKGYFKNIDADVLKVAHHGSTTSTSQDFLDKVDCEYAIISCGAGNKYKHPTNELMARLENYVDLTPDDDYNGFAQIYRTDEDGTITVQVNGKGGIIISSEKTPDKNVNTETEIEGVEISSGDDAVALIFTVKRNYNDYGIAA